jgi:hypothetical protein
VAFDENRSPARTVEVRVLAESASAAVATARRLGDHLVRWRDRTVVAPAREAEQVLAARLRTAGPAAAPDLARALELAQVARQIEEGRISRPVRVSLNAGTTPQQARDVVVAAAAGGALGLFLLLAFRVTRRPAGPRERSA